MGLPTGRSVSFTDPVIWNRRTRPTRSNTPPSCPAGTVKRVEYPHHGFSVSVTRTVTDANRAVIHTDTYYSNYQTVNGVTQIGTG